MAEVVNSALLVDGAPGSRRQYIHIYVYIYKGAGDRKKHLCRTGIYCFDEKWECCPAGL
jgi:hypothetical protein